MKTSTIMPGSTHHPKTYEVCLRAIQTHKATCDADLVFLDNNSDRVDLQAALKKECQALGYRYEYLTGDVHINAFYNYGTELTALDKEPSEFLAYCNADVVFHDAWLSNLLDAWETGDNRNHFISLHPYSYSPDIEGLCYRKETEPEDTVISCDHPLMHVSVFRRSSGFIFDKQFPFWETDRDWETQPFYVRGVTVRV